MKDWIGKGSSHSACKLYFYMRKIMFSVKGIKHYTIFVGCGNIINLVLAVLFSHS